MNPDGLADITKIIQSSGLFEKAMSSMSTMKDTPRNDNPAMWTYERLCKLFNDFENALDDEHEIGIRLVSFGYNDAYHISGLGYWGPDMMIFNCSAGDGSPVDLIQNISQLNVLLLALPKVGEKPRRIGFGQSES